jgi:predicted small secreted protein
MMKNQFKYLLTVFVVLSAGLAACSQVQGPVGTDLPLTAAEAIPSQESAVVTETQVTTTGETESEPIQSAEASVEKPTPRVGLVATDPSTVSLASGEIQLVEFFAFW